MRCPLLLPRRMALASFALALVSAQTHYADGDGRLPARHVRWYLPVGGQAFKADSEAWLSDARRRAAMTGVYACCNFFEMLDNGTVLVDDAGVYAPPSFSSSSSSSCDESMGRRAPHGPSEKQERGCGPERTGPQRART